MASRTLARFVRAWATGKLPGRLSGIDGAGQTYVRGFLDALMLSQASMKRAVAIPDWAPQCSCAAAAHSLSAHAPNCAANPPDGFLSLHAHSSQTPPRMADSDRVGGAFVQPAFGHCKPKHRPKNRPGRSTPPPPPPRPHLYFDTRPLAGRCCRWPCRRPASAPAHRTAATQGAGRVQPNRRRRNAAEWGTVLGVCMRYPGDAAWPGAIDGHDIAEVHACAAVARVDERVQPHALLERPDEHSVDVVVDDVSAPSKVRRADRLIQAIELLPAVVMDLSAVPCTAHSMASS